MKEGRISERHADVRGWPLVFWKGVSIVPVYHFSLISLIPPQSRGHFNVQISVRSHVFLHEVTLLQQLFELDH